jgi:hypothetical protein
VADAQCRILARPSAREVPAGLKQSGAVSNCDVKELPREKLMRIAASGA